MIRVHTIDSLDLPELGPYRTMRRQMEHREEGIFVAESDKVVQRLLESDLTVISLLLPEKWLEGFHDLLEKRPEQQINVYVLEKKKLEALTGFSFYQGVLAVAHVPPAPTLDAALRPTGRARLFAAVEGVTSAENLGGLVRNCAAFDVHALLVGATSTSPYLRRAVRGSMGTVFKLPILEKLDLVPTVGLLKQHGINCVAAHPHVDRRTLRDVDLTVDCCVIFGSEGYGISKDLLEACNEAAAIPMAPGVDSLNVGSAAAVFLYEAARQRALPPGARIFASG
jgi:tRNA G18 (ribose-2'-O)-methylase SpoU